MSSSFAMWSPHRDSREVILWKSMLGFRSEPWHWVDDLAHARWYVVDVARGVDPAWTDQLSRHTSVRGIALARHWTDVPAPCWTFFKVPLQLDNVSRWLDQLHRTTTPRLRTVAGGARSGQGALRQGGTRTGGQPIAISWQGQLLRLTRWPDVNRYSDGSMELTVVCARLLREWAPYDELIAGTRNQHGLRSLLRDAQINGSLRSAPAAQVTPIKRIAMAAAVPTPAAPVEPPPGPGAQVELPAHARPPGTDTSADTGPHSTTTDQRRQGLLRRLWSRFA